MEGWPEKKTILVYIGAFSFALFLGLLVSFVYEGSALEGQVPRGVLLDGRCVSGLDRSGLLSVLDPARKGVERSVVELSLEGHSRKFRVPELGVSLDVEAAIERVLLLGRHGSLVSRFGSWVGRLLADEEVPLTLAVERKKLSETLRPWAQEFLQEPVLPSIRFERELLVEAGRGGTVIEYEQLAKLLRERATSSAKLSIPTHERKPVVSDVEVARVRREAEALLEGPIEVVLPEKARAVRLSVAEVGAALQGRVDEAKGSVALHIDVDSLKQSMMVALREIEVEPVEAGFEFSSTGVPSVTPSREGRVLDEEGFEQALLGISKGGARRFTAPFRVQKPKLSTEEAEGLGVKGLVMSFTTRHDCCQPRVQNIHHAAAKLDGLVLRPGERFSLNEFLGPRQKSTGYQKAPTIVRGEMEDVYGGGISQLATTLFNAVLRGGYEIIQRQPHSVYFSRYPEGHEATVSFPEPDLIFRNDTEAGMVIKTQAEPTYIRVLVFGDNGGRVVSVDKGRRYDIVEPPKEYEPDETMPPEKMKRLRAGQLGWTVLVSRKVKYPSGDVKEEKREVVYSARPELLRVHPCVIPEGVEGHTGEKCPEPEIVEEEEELSEDAYFETL